MPNINPAFLPEMRGRVERAVEAMDSIDDMVTCCVEEYQTAQEAFLALQKRQAELVTQFTYFETLLAERERTVSDSERRRLQEQLADIARRSAEVNEATIELAKSIMELTRAITAIKLSAKVPEVAEA